MYLIRVLTNKMIKLKDKSKKIDDGLKKKMDDPLLEKVIDENSFDDAWKEVREEVNVHTRSIEDVKKKVSKKPNK